jgi:hypothetical protein
VYYRVVDGEKHKGKYSENRGSVVQAKLRRDEEKPPKKTENQAAISGYIEPIMRLRPSEFR